MKKILFITLFAFIQILSAQNPGTIKGLLTDKENNNEPLPFASVQIKGTTIGTETDFDGNFVIIVPAGNQIVVFSYLGYKIVEKTVLIKEGETLTVNQIMTAEEGVALDEIKIVAETNKEKASALLVEQMKAKNIKESIGAERMSDLAISNASVATTKISGVTQSEESGDIYIRGLGDRYLSTTMNNLPIPSDNVDNKNIDMSLFSSNVINNISISKTYNVSGYADQSSGIVNITTKKYAKKSFNFSVNSGVNTEVAGIDGNFRSTLIYNSVDFFGYHDQKFFLKDAIVYQGWDPVVRNNSKLNRGFSFSGAYKLKVLGKELALFATASKSNTFEYQAGEFSSYRSNILDNAFPHPNYDPSAASNNSPSVEKFITNINTTAYIRGDLKLNDNHKIAYNTLFVVRGKDELYEQGRNGLGYVFDQQPQEEGAFVRDQNYKQTILFVNQLMGEHKLSENNKLSWAGGYNFVRAKEPNRIRNEAIILDSSTVTYADVSNFSQRKSKQNIEDNDFNGYLVNAYNFGTLDEDENKPYSLNVGANFRYRERNFSSQFIGVETPGFTGQSTSGFTTSSVDNISSTFIASNFLNSATPQLKIKEQPLDLYNADMTIMAGFASLDFKLNNTISGNVGLRFERDEINVLWNVKNYQGPLGARVGNKTREYTSLFPSLNLKYELNEKSFIRLASSLTQTLPEFKELAPFQYEEPTGRVIQGNPSLERSKVLNIDLKWELFPKRGELLSATAFYKNIKDPINLALTRGSSGNFEFNNTGEKATVFGFEFEGRFNIIENEDEQAILKANANITQMWFEQDLLTNFQYFNKTSTGLQGASNFITNASLSYNNRREKPFTATLTGNYASDKIFALGGPEDLTNRAVLFNDEIIEKGFVTLDLVVSKQITKNLFLKVIGRNLLDPNIQQTQKITRFDNNDIQVSSGDKVVQTYKKGVQLNVNLSYKF